MFKAPSHCLLPSCSGHTYAPRGLHSPHSTPPLFLNPAPLPLGKFLLCCPHHSGNDSDSLETGPQGNHASKKLPGQFLGPVIVGNNSVNTDISLPGFLPSKPHPGLFYSPHTEAPSRNMEWAWAKRRKSGQTTPEGKRGGNRLHP